jgi:hypothetical protein
MKLGRFDEGRGRNTRCMNHSKSSHGKRQPGLHPLSVADVVLANALQTIQHRIVKGGRKRRDSARGGDASEVRYLYAPKTSTEEQVLDLRFIHLSHQEISLRSEVHDLLLLPTLELR